MPRIVLKNVYSKVLKKVSQFWIQSESSKNLEITI